MISNLFYPRRICETFTIFSNFGPLRLDEVSFKCLKRSGYFHGAMYRKPKLTLRTLQISANDIIDRLMFTYFFSSFQLFHAYIHVNRPKLKVGPLPNHATRFDFDDRLCRVPNISSVLRYTAPCTELDFIWGNSCSGHISISVKFQSCFKYKFQNFTFHFRFFLK
jgi:hypothetical protein